MDVWRSADPVPDAKSISRRAKNLPKTGLSLDYELPHLFFHSIWFEARFSSVILIKCLEYAAVCFLAWPSPLTQKYYDYYIYPESQQ